MTGPEINARILALRLEGKTWSVIAGDLEMSVRSIENRVSKLRRAGCTLFPRIHHDRLDEWPAERIEKLRALWDDGLSCAAIGRELHLSKNSIVGKARRLELPPRGSPIIRVGEPRPRSRPPRHLRPVWRPTATLAPLASAQTPPVALLAAKPEPLPLAAPVRPAVRRVMAPCQWPEGEKPDYRWCGDPVAALGVPYCRQHMAAAYVRPTHRPGAP